MSYNFCGLDVQKESIANVFLSCYDDTADGGADDGGAGDGGGKPPAGGGGAGGSGGSGDPVVKNQTDLNLVLKREKEKFRQRDEKRAQELETMKNTLKLTEEQKEQFELQIEELRTAHLTEQEKAKRNEDKLNKEWQGKFESESGRAKHWESQYTRHKIETDIMHASLNEGVIKQNIKFLEAFLLSKTRLVENQGDDGQPTGTYTAKVKIDLPDKEGKPVTMDLTIPEVVKAMKEMPDEYGYLFEAHTKGGLGGDTHGGGGGGRKPKVASMSTADYMARRKKDPASLDLT